MATITGKVESKSKAGTGIKMNGKWYNGTTSMLANVNWKDEVSIEVDDSGKVTAVNTAAAPAASGSGGGGKSTYIDNQPVIAFQAARNAAISMLDSAVATSSIKLPAKEADRLQALEAFVDQFTERFYTQAMALRNGDPVDVVLFGTDDE